MRKILESKIIKILFVCFILLLLYALYVFFSFNPSKEPFIERYSKSVFDANGEVLSIFLNKDEQWHIKDDEPLPPKLKNAILTYEDKSFYSHFGIDLGAILRSLYNNLNGKKRSGASTISMQTIKLLNNSERTYFNKFKEMILALRLESLFSKDEILQMYANNAPYGGNIVGFKTASLLYFNKLPKNLSWGESALLAVLPNAPGLMHLNKNTTRLLQKRNTLLQRLYDKGLLDSDNLKLATSEKLPSINRAKNIAPHLSLRLANSNSSVNIYSSLQKPLQLKLESRLKRYHQHLLNLGIQNTAAIIIDTQSAKVIAYAGSQDFFDIKGYGQIDGIVAKRSVGSTLKPLLYALTIDDGLISQDSKLVDAPTFFSNFKPQNASKKYYGLISARTALIKSLNVPFVGLLQDYGYERFFFDLKDIIGFSDSNFERYGLSLILGTKELSMEDIAKIYLGLGNYGEFRNLIYLRDSKDSAKKRILSRGASYLTLDAMRYLDRLGLENYYKNSKIFSWKSGTSYGRKDAWAAGTSPKYTIVVWAGNFDGSSNPNLFGVNIAGDLLFSILGDLGDLGGEFKKPQDSLHNIKIDLITGYKYSSDYINIGAKETPYPNDAKTLRKSPFLKNVFIDSNDNELNSLDSGFINAKKMTKLSLPLNLLAYYKEQQITPKRAKKSLAILYPKNNIKIARTKDFDGENELVARIANLNNSEVFWYVDKKYLGHSNKNTKSLKLGIGKHSLTIIDSEGESDSVEFSIIK